VFAEAGPPAPEIRARIQRQYERVCGFVHVDGKMIGPFVRGAVPYHEGVVDVKVSTCGVILVVVVVVTEELFP